MGKLATIQRVVGADPNLQVKIASENGPVTPDSGFDGLSLVNVNVQPPLQEKTITANGEVVADPEYYGLSKVNVAVEPNLLEGQVFDSNGIYPVPEGKDGFGSFQINVPTEDVPDWTPPADWVNIKSVITNDSKVADSKVICLLDNYDDSFTFTLVNSEGLTAIKFNDGTLYEGAGTYTHTFDPANDIIAGNERHRWMILYFNGEIGNRYLARNLILRDSILWAVFLNNTIISNSNNSTATFSSCAQLQCVEEINDGDIQFLDMNDRAIYFNGCTSLQKIKASLILRDYVDNRTGNIRFESKYGGCRSLKKLPHNTIIISNSTNSQPFYNMCSHVESLEEFPTLINDASFSSTSGQQSPITSTFGPKIKELNMYLRNYYGIFPDGQTLKGLKIINCMNAKPIRYSFCLSSAFTTLGDTVTIIKGLDFTNIDNGGSLMSSSASFKNTSVKYLEIKENTLNVNYRFDTSALTEESQWQMVNCLVDRSATTSLVLTIPLELYQKMTTDMITAITNKNWTISAY